MTEPTGGPTGAPQTRSNARGRRFLVPLLAAWPIGLAIGAVAILAGASAAAGIAGGLSVALGLDVLWLGVTFALDDGDADERGGGQSRIVEPAVRDAHAHGAGR